MKNTNETLENLVIELESKIPKEGSINEAISKSSAGWHIEHSLLTINGIIDYLKKSDPKAYRWKFNLIKIFVFASNKIPRGRGRSPDPVKPKNNFTAGTLKNHAEFTKEKLKELKALHPHSYFEHPYFGKLKLNQTIKFIKIHTKHHIYIINDIIGRSN